MLPQRAALAEIELAGVTIPKNAPIVLVLASGNQDPKQFDEPDRFQPTRRDNRHFGFGGGVHSCVGAPLARIEAQIALTELTGRLVDPKLLQDPPPYRSSPILRGLCRLPLEVEAIRP
jgi:cytochrome P450